MNTTLSEGFKLVSRKKTAHGLLFLFVLVLFTFPIALSWLQQGSVMEGRMLKEKDLPFLTKISTPKVWVYFGYVGCADVCPTAIKQLDSHLLDDQTSIYFINLIPGLTDQQVQAYVDGFEVGQVRGVQASETDLAHIEHYFSNLENGRIGVYQPELHTDQVFFLQKEAERWTLHSRTRHSKISSTTFIQ